MAHRVLLPQPGPHPQPCPQSATRGNVARLASLGLAFYPRGSWTLFASFRRIAKTVNFIGSEVRVLAPLRRAGLGVSGHASAEYLDSEPLSSPIGFGRPYFTATDLNSGSPYWA